MSPENGFTLQMLYELVFVSGVDSDTFHLVDDEKSVHFGEVTLDFDDWCFSLCELGALDRVAGELTITERIEVHVSRGHPDKSRTTIVSIFRNKRH